MRIGPVARVSLRQLGGGSRSRGRCGLRRRVCELFLDAVKLMAGTQDGVLELHPRLLQDGEIGPRNGELSVAG